MTRAKGLSFLLASTLVLACSYGPGGGGGGAGAEGGDGDATAGLSFLGEWSGTFENKGAEEDSALRESTASAVFKADVAEADAVSTVGDFKFTFPDLDGVKVQGRFQDFASHSIMLSIDDSNLSAIGNKGSKTSFDYEVVGNRFELSNNRVRFLLVKKGTEGSNAGTGNGSGSNATPAHPYIGHWDCRDAGGRAWDLHIKSLERFTADIRLPDEPSVWYDGAVELLPDGNPHNAKLVVVSSFVKKDEGSFLFFTKRTDVEATLTANGEDIPCDKRG